MANPVARLVPQYDKAGSVAASGYWFKFFEPGTTTPITMFTDAAETTPLDKAELNSQGYPNTVGNDLFIPHVNQTYDLWMFPTEAEADANDTSNAVMLADNIDPIASNIFFDSIASMKASSTPAGELVQTEAYYTGWKLGATLGPIGGGIYSCITRSEYDTTRGNALGPDNVVNGSGFVDHLDDGNGNVYSLHHERVNVTQAGTTNGSFDDSARFTALISLQDTKAIIYVPESTYDITAGVSDGGKRVLWIVDGASFIGGTLPGDVITSIFDIHSPMKFVSDYDSVNDAMGDVATGSTLFIDSSTSFDGVTVSKRLNFVGLGREYTEVSGTINFTGTGGNSTWNNIRFNAPSGTMQFNVVGIGGGNFRDCHFVPGSGVDLFSWDTSGSTPQIWELMQCKVDVGRFCDQTNDTDPVTCTFHVKEASLFSFTEANSLQPSTTGFINLAIFNSLMNINDPQISSTSRANLQILGGCTIDDNTTGAAWIDNNGTGFDNIEVSGTNAIVYPGSAKQVVFSPWYAGSGLSGTQANSQPAVTVGGVVFNGDHHDVIYITGDVTATATTSYLITTGGQHVGQTVRMHLLGKITTQGNNVNFLDVIINTNVGDIISNLVGWATYDGATWIGALGIPVISGAGSDQISPTNATGSYGV